jgi:hypothetical protein
MTVSVLGPIDAGDGNHHDLDVLALTTPSRKS